MTLFDVLAIGDSAEASDTPNKSVKKMLVYIFNGME